MRMLLLFLAASSSLLPLSITTALSEEKPITMLEAYFKGPEVFYQAASEPFRNLPKRQYKFSQASLTDVLPAWGGCWIEFRS